MTQPHEVRPMTDAEATALIIEVVTEVETNNESIANGAAGQLDRAGRIMFRHHLVDCQRALRLGRWGLAKRREAEDARAELATVKRMRISERRVLRDEAGRVTGLVEAALEG